jgi:hypothetical protein
LILPKKRQSQSQGSKEEEEEFHIKSEPTLRDYNQTYEVFDLSSFNSLGKGEKSAKRISAEVKNTIPAKKKEGKRKVF